MAAKEANKNEGKVKREREKETKEQIEIVNDCEGSTGTARDAGRPATVQPGLA